MTLETRPEAVTVGSLTYGIEFTHPVKDDDGIEVWGITDHRHLMIRIDSDLNALMQRQVTLHEILHTIYFVGLGMLEKHGSIRLIEEQIVGLLESPLFMVLRNNPRVFAWLEER